MLKFIKSNFFWIKDIAIILFCLCVLYLNANYVTITQFRELEKSNFSQHEAIQLTLISVDKTLALMQQNQTILTEHDILLKSHDKWISSLDNKLKIIETLDLSSQVKVNTFKLLDLEFRMKNFEKK